MTPAAAAAPFPRPTPNTTPQPSSISQKSRKTQNKKLFSFCMSMGVHRNEFLVLKLIFILYINGGAQEGKYDFIKIFFFDRG